MKIVIAPFALLALVLVARFHVDLVLSAHLAVFFLRRALSVF